jgi:hypothetical protein
MDRTRTATITLKSTVCLICCHISTPPVAAKFVVSRHRRNYSPEILETPPAGVAGAAGDVLPRN